VARIADHRVTFAAAPLPETFQIRVFFRLTATVALAIQTGDMTNLFRQKTVTPLQYSLAIVAAMTTPRCGRSRRTHGQAESQ
jgi:hypothetical protein